MRRKHAEGKTDGVLQKRGLCVSSCGCKQAAKSRGFYTGNRGLTEELLALLQGANSKAPVLITSSIQATLDNDYGKSKREAEALLFTHAQQNASPVYVYRLPGVFGKWYRPFYNNVVATLRTTPRATCL